MFFGGKLGSCLNTGFFFLIYFMVFLHVFNFFNVFYVNKRFFAAFFKWITWSWILTKQSLVKILPPFPLIMSFVALLWPIIFFWWWVRPFMQSKRHLKKKKKLNNGFHVLSVTFCHCYMATYILAHDFSVSSLSPENAIFVVNFSLFDTLLHFFHLLKWSTIKMFSSWRTLRLVFYLCELSFYLFEQWTVKPFSFLSTSQFKLNSLNKGFFFLFLLLL